MTNFEYLELSNRERETNNNEFDFSLRKAIFNHVTKSKFHLDVPSHLFWYFDFVLQQSFDLNEFKIGTVENAIKKLNE